MKANHTIIGKNLLGVYLLWLIFLTSTIEYTTLRVSSVSVSVSPKNSIYY